MSTVVIPPQSPDALLDVKIVQQIQTALSTDLSAWLEAAFGLAHVAEIKKESGAIERYPRVVTNLDKNNYYDVRYSDQVKSLCFFERDGETRIAQNADESEHRIPMSIVFWVDLSKIDTGRNYDFTEQLAADALEALTSNFSSEIEVVAVDLRIPNAYSKYTLTDLDSRFLSLPYSAFRIRFEYICYPSVRCYSFVPTGGTANTLVSQVTILNATTGATITTVAAPGSYSVLQFSDIVDTTPTTIPTDEIIDDPF